jgi:hypothetical protein
MPDPNDYLSQGLCPHCGEPLNIPEATPRGKYPGQSRPQGDYDLAPKSYRSLADLMKDDRFDHLPDEDDGWAPYED